MTLKSDAPTFKSQYITAELARLFSQSDSEEEFQGFSEEEAEEDGRCFQKQQKTEVVDSEGESDKDTGFYSDGEEPPEPKRRSLLVALRFPGKKEPAPPKIQNKKNVRGSDLPRRGRGRPRKVNKKEKDKEDEEEEEEEEEEDAEVVKEKKEELCQSLIKRDRNIQENKAMLAKLFAGLTSLADLTPLDTPQKRKRISQKVSPQKRKFKSDVGSERRNPSRKARPPENFGVEEKPEPTCIRKPRTLDIWRLMEVDEERIDRRKRKKRSPNSRKSQFMVKSVDEITDEDLENVAYRSRDKIWDKDNGSSCHQCRQKTLDTKTVCRSGYCVGVKGQFCGPCLKNRYGEDVRTVLLDPTWSCPICRGVCNCSLCRKKEGRCATGTLVALARYNGHDNVHEYLESIQKELQ